MALLACVLLRSYLPWIPIALRILKFARASSKQQSVAASLHDVQIVKIMLVAADRAGQNVRELAAPVTDADGSGKVVQLVNMPVQLRADANEATVDETPSLWVFAVVFCLWFQNVD